MNSLLYVLLGIHFATLIWDFISFSNITKHYMFEYIFSIIIKNILPNWNFNYAYTRPLYSFNFKIYYLFDFVCYVTGNFTAVFSGAIYSIYLVSKFSPIFSFSRSFIYLLFRNINIGVSHSFIWFSILLFLQSIRSLISQTH